MLSLPGIRRSYRPLAALVGLAIVTAVAHRAWIHADPCARLPLPAGNPVLEQLAFQHDNQLRWLMGAHQAAQAADLMLAPRDRQVDVLIASYASFTNEVRALAEEQHRQMGAACRRIPRK